MHICSALQLFGVLDMFRPAAAADPSGYGHPVSVFGLVVESIGLGF